MPAICDDRGQFAAKNASRVGEKVDELPAEEFLRRFLQQILPDGFCRIRHYGLLANCVKRQRLAECRRFLGVWILVAEELPQTAAQSLQVLLGIDITRCPKCGSPLHCVTFSAPDTSPSPSCSQPTHCRGAPWDIS